MPIYTYNCRIQELLGKSANNAETDDSSSSVVVIEDAKCTEPIVDKTSDDENVEPVVVHPNEIVSNDATSLSDDVKDMKASKEAAK